MSDSSDLHLPDLTIKGFRGIEELKIPRLGRVTLLVGKNSVGKTTVLDAVRIYAARGRRLVLQDVLAQREEVLPAVDEQGRDALEADWPALFHRGAQCSTELISIGGSRPDRQLTIERGVLDEQQVAGIEKVSSSLIEGDEIEALKVRFCGNETIAAWWSAAAANHAVRTTASPIGGIDRFLRREHRLLNNSEPPAELPCEVLGPDLIDNSRMSGFWDTAVTNGCEAEAVDALRLIFGDAVRDVVIVGSGGARLPNRRALVGMQGQSRRVPLKSLGDGALRLFAIALTLLHSKGGFLLLDEVENGLYRSLHHGLWRMILRTAERNNIQVIATTHGWDCATGFARAAAELDQIDGLLMRLDRERGDLRAVNYSKEGLLAAAEQGIEVR